MTDGRLVGNATAAAATTTSATATTATAAAAAAATAGSELEFGGRCGHRCRPTARGGGGGCGSGSRDIWNSRSGTAIQPACLRSSST